MTTPVYSRQLPSKLVNASIGVGAWGNAREGHGIVGRAAHCHVPAAKKGQYGFTVKKLVSGTRRFGNTEGVAIGTGGTHGREPGTS